jgi:hypothetical protein
MYNADKIIPGIIIFLAIIAFPVWYTVSAGNPDYAPEPVVPAGEKQCVESTQYMKDYHPKLLLEWREAVVREGIHTYVASDGKEYDMSLTGTCLSCHSNKTEFCDTCHNYSDVQPNCWSCHNVPEGNK